MASLTGQKIKDTYQSLLKVGDNGKIAPNFKNISDGSGSTTGLYLKNDGVLVSGSFIVSGSLDVSGSFFITEIYGNLIGTASFATSASQAISASLAQTASFAPNYTTLVGFNAFTSSYKLDSGSFDQRTDLLENAMSGSKRLYVSPEGLDTNDGTEPHKPFKTIKAAVDSLGAKSPFNIKRFTIFVGSGDYTEQNPIIVPPGAAIVGDNLRTVRLTAANPTKDFFHVYESTYFYGLRFLNLKHPAFCFSFPCSIATATISGGQVTGLNLIHSATGYTDGVNQNIDILIEEPDAIGTAATAVATISGGVITGFTVTSGGSGYVLGEKPLVSIPIPAAVRPFVGTSPYIQNCSSITGPFDTSGNQISVFTPLPYDTTNVDDQGAGGGIRIDGNLNAVSTPLRSMVADSFTQVNQGGPGHLVINRGYAQFVSCFTTFCTYGFKTAAGGFANVSNSVIDFGKYGLISKTYYPVTYNTGSSLETKTSTVSGFVIDENGAGYTGSVANVTITGGGASVNATAQANINANGSVDEIVLLTGGSGYTDQPNVTIAAPTGVGGIQATTVAGKASITGVSEMLISLVSGSRSVDISSNMRLNGVNYLITGVAAVSGQPSQKRITTYPSPSSIATGDVVNFYDLSNISTGGLVNEYVGSGVTYNALPQYGGIPIKQREVTQIAPGKVFYVTIDNIGNLAIGSFFAVNQLTGEVTINANSFNLSGLNAIGPFKRNGVPVGVVLQEVSNNTALINSQGIYGEDTAPTQYAVQQYVAVISSSIGTNIAQTSASIASNIAATSASLMSLSSSYASLSSSFRSGSYSGSFSGFFSGSLGNLRGRVQYIPAFASNDTLVTSSMYQIYPQSIAINQEAITTAAPEALYVWQSSTSSFNVISGKGNLNNYLQLNIQNTNQGVSASSDVVATANNGDENTNYINMGINGGNFVGPVGLFNDAYLFSAGRHLHIGNTANYPVQIFAGGSDTDANRKASFNPNGAHEITGSLDISDRLIVRNGITGSLFGNASTAISSSYALSASQAQNTILFDGRNRQIFATTGSNSFIGSQTITGSVNISGSTTQIGNNTLLGTTVLSGSVTISGSLGSTIPSVQIYGDIRQTGYHRFDPVTTNIDNTVSASYIYVSGSTNDLYFSQNGNGYANTTRLRWLEGNLYTGLLNGGVIGSSSSTVYTISSGSGIIVDLNASLSDNPYPTVKYINWTGLSASIAPQTGSYDQTFVGIDDTGNIYAQGTPFVAGQFDTIINIGLVLHQNRSTIIPVKTQPGVAYGAVQRNNIFTKAFGPLKLSGFTLAASGSSTGSLIVGSGTAYADGASYTVDPDNPSYVVDNGTSTSKIFRYRQSGSQYVYDTNAGAGYQVIDSLNYSNNGVLTSVGAGNFSIQRVFWFPNSVAKAIVVYYGNAVYTTLANAIANVNIESFVEAPNTAANAVYLGAICISGANNASLQTPADCTILPSGLFRSVGGSGGGGSTITQTLAGLSDVAISGPVNHQLLAYDSTAAKWTNQSTITATLIGNASTATTASFATFALTASYISGSGGTGAGFPFSGSAIITGSLLVSSSLNVLGEQTVTGSLNVSAGITGSLFGTASQAVSSSYALTASYAANVPQTASYALQAASSSFAVTSSYAQVATTSSYAVSFQIGGALTEYATVNTSIVGSNNLFTKLTGSLTSGFYKYTVFSGSNARAGEVFAVWNGGNVEYTDISTNDLGTTATVTASVVIINSEAQFNIQTNDSAWRIKSTVTYL
jgi:hypothetical protein